MRILTAYTREVQPSSTLTTLATFVMRVYAESWFSIKRSNNLSGIPMVYFEAVKAFRALNLDAEATSTFHDALSRNAFALLPENMLHAMVSSEDRVVRSKAASFIREIRNRLDFFSCCKILIN